MSSHEAWKHDITNRFSPTSLTDVAEGDGFVATAVIAGVTTVSGWKMSDWDAYLDLREKLLNGEVRPLPEITSPQRDTLTDVSPGTEIFNVTTDKTEVWTGSIWVASGGEQGGIIHFPAATIITTDNTETVLTKVTLEENTAYLVTAEVIGELTDHSVVLGAIIECTAKRVTGGSALIVGNVSIAHTGKDSGAASWSTDFTVSGNDLRLVVKGGNAVTVNWEADLNYLKF